MSLPGLNAADREFFAALADVVFGNPFTPQRDQLIVRLAPGAPLGDLTSDREALARIVGPRLEPWLREGAPALQKLSAEDRRLLEPGFLYVCYHRCVPQLDALIERQAGLGGAPLAVPFADDAIADLVRSGFPEERAVRYFALFFQLRRAFYFILDSLAGECGTGKGSAAAAIGRSEFIPYVVEQRRFAANFAETFITINLSQFPETLIESELFGHRKGAFTGAIEHHEGVFERCNAHGALFLDEIGEASIPVQIKLLQVLQERTFTALGGHEKKRFSGRVIAATNRPLVALRRDGRFRDDFFYRLCSDVIEVPTLRQRVAESPAELEQLVRLLVARVTGAQAPELVAAVLEALDSRLPRGYPWPGNVRELEQAVRRILLTGRYAAELPQAAQSEDEALIEKLRAGELTAAELLARYCALLYRRLGTYAEVAKRTGLDPRTSRKYVESGKSNAE